MVNVHNSSVHVHLKFALLRTFSLKQCSGEGGKERRCSGEGGRPRAGHEGGEGGGGQAEAAEGAGEKGLGDAEGARHERRRGEPETLNFRFLQPLRLRSSVLEPDFHLQINVMK